MRVKIKINPKLMQGNTFSKRWKHIPDQLHSYVEICVLKENAFSIFVV